MGVSAGGGGGTNQTPSYKTNGEKLTRALVIEEVKIVEITKTVEVPVIKYVEKEQTVYKDVPKEQTKYVTKEESTTKYVPVEESTIKYSPKTEETIKYVVKEVVVEKPVILEREYEKPVLKEVVYETILKSDIELIKQALIVIPKLSEAIKALEAKLISCISYTLVEQEIKVPKVVFIPTEVERVVWKNVERERPNNP